MATLVRNDPAKARVNGSCSQHDGFPEPDGDTVGTSSRNLVKRKSAAGIEELHLEHVVRAKQAARATMSYESRLSSLWLSLVCAVQNWERHPPA